MKNISISKKGILKLINNINPQKVEGPDNIAGKILKENAKMLLDSRCSIILVAITCSSSLQEIQVRDIGL
jgi:hypothetical protein